MKEIDLSGFYCPNEGCIDYGKTGTGNIVLKGRYGENRTALLNISFISRFFFVPFIQFLMSIPAIILASLNLLGQLFYTRNTLNAGVEVKGEGIKVRGDKNHARETIQKFYIHTAKVVMKREMRKTILIAGIAICIICAALISYGFIKFTQRDVIPSQDLTLSDYPKLFTKEAVIVIGENVSQIEKESAEAIAANLENLTGNKPEIINTKKIESFKYIYNLIMVGTPNSNKVLEEVYNMTDAIRVTEEYPGENKGILEILRNPWNEEKAMLLVEGSDEEGMVAGINELYWLQLSKRNFDNSQGDIITVVGTLREVISQWSLSFDECVFDSPSIEVNGKNYYLENVCPYLYLFSGNLTERRIIVASESDFIMPGKTVKVTGKIVKREVEIPLRKEPNPPTKIEIFDVIVVSDLEVQNESTNER